jgi:hypothetical protein
MRNKNISSEISDAAMQGLIDEMYEKDGED